MEDKVIDVYELTGIVEVTGVKLTCYKYPTKKTFRYYVGIVVTPALRERGYSYGLSQRVRDDAIGKVRPVDWHAPLDRIARRAYYLDGQEEEVIKKMREDIEQTIESMYTNVSLLRTAWQNRPTRPDKHEDSIRKVDTGKTADGGVAVPKVPGVDAGDAAGIS